MITVLVQVEADAASIEALKPAIAKMEAASRAEAGCIDYTFTQELSDPNRMRIIEKWESMDVLRAHFAEPHMAEFQAAMAAHPAKGMDVKVYELGEDLGLPT